MILKRFITASLLAASGLYANACAYEGTHNYYMFSVFNHDYTGENYAVARINQSDFTDKINQNWTAYTGGEIRTYDSARLRRYAMVKGDQQMLKYIKLLDRYLKVAGSYKETWTYPTKKQMALRNTTLQNVRAASLAQTRSKIRSQYALLYMRCNMLLKQYATNVKFWNTTVKGMPNSVYRDMMMDIYAGCLTRTGRADEGCEIFASLEDIPSIGTWMMGKRNLKGISDVYQRNPNAATLPFLIQEFVNNAQETVDDEKAEKTGGYNIYGKLFVKKTYRNEVNNFCMFANKVVAEGKTKTPALWKTAAAWLHFMFGDTKTGQQEIDNAITLSGTDRMMDNARAIRLYITSANTDNPDILDKYITHELDWLYNMAEKNGANSSSKHYTEVFDRLVNQQLVPKYDHWNRNVIATALVGTLQTLQSVSGAPSYGENQWNSHYSNDYFERLDSLNGYTAKCYLDYLQHHPSDELDKWLISHNSRNYDYLNDIVGTHYLRQGEFTKAIEYLERVPLTFLDGQNISQYMATRSFTQEKWFSHIKHDVDETSGKTHLTSNMKIQFAKAMNDLEAKYSVANDEERIRLAYDMATRYYQASHYGNCWFLTHYGWSISDSTRVGEADFVARAINYLDIAKNATVFNMKEKALYALAYIPMQPWCTEDWDYNTSKNVYKYNRGNRQYMALQELAAFEKQNTGNRPSIYVTKCDVLKRFSKLTNN